MTFNRQIRFWKDCAKRLPEKLAKESVRIADKARTARNHRDLLLHGFTYADDSGKTYAVMFNSKKEKIVENPQHIPVPTSKVLKNAYETRALTADFFGHLAQVAGLLQAKLRQKLVAQGRLPDTGRSRSAGF